VAQPLLLFAEVFRPRRSGGGNRGQYEELVVVCELPGANCVGRAWTVQHLWVGGRCLDRVAHGDVASRSSQRTEAGNRTHIKR